jgi:hypothetical protein
MLRFRGTTLICVLLFCALASRTLGQTASMVSFVDANGQPAESYLEETRAYLRVVDPGADVNAASGSRCETQLKTSTGTPPCRARRRA